LPTPGWDQLVVGAEVAGAMVVVVELVLEELVGTDVEVVLPHPPWWRPQLEAEAGATVAAMAPTTTATATTSAVTSARYRFPPPLVV
jgi:hypothetical protein